MDALKKNYFDLELNSQQQKAFDALCLFLEGTQDRVFILKGYAGTGKTTLMSGLIKRMGEKKIPFALLASTGRAAKILSDKTKEPAHTIHSHIYVFNDLSEDLEKMSHLQQNLEIDDKGQINLLFNLKPINSKDGKIYIVDEASMISDETEKSASFAKFGNGDLLGDILKYDKNGKIIFVGDPCQLPPINQKNSPALSALHISAKYGCNASDMEMTEVVRHSHNNGILQASLRLRNLFYKNAQERFASLPLKGYSNIIFEDSHAGMINQYLQRLNASGVHSATMICQTNKHCADLNKVIRSTLYSNPLGLNVGDLLMVSQNNYLSNLVNGDQIMVLKTGQREYRCGLSFLQVEVEEISSKSKFNLLVIEEILTSTYTNLNVKQHKDLMIDYYQRMKAQGIKQGSSAFKANMLKDPYLNALRVVYGYAITCHKAQGGEWDHIYLYLDNKIHGIPKPSIYQWVYTAITRAKYNLHIVNDWFIK